MKLKSGNKVIYKNEIRTIYLIYSKALISLCFIDKDGYEYNDVEEDFKTPTNEIQLLTI